MEAFLFIGIIAATVFAYNLGVKAGEKKILRDIEHSAHSGMNPQSAFAKTYGRPGFYLGKLHPDLNTGPLAVTCSADLLKLVAKERLGRGASSVELSAEIEKMTDAYHLANGWTPEKLAAIKDISKQVYRNAGDI